MPHGRLRSVMTPLDLAWSVLKADPESQAWDRSYASQHEALAHPDLPAAMPESLEIRNRGTIDPRVMSMRARMVTPFFGRSYGTEVAGRETTPEQGFGTSFGDRSDYMNMDDTAGFTALSPVGGISRVDRPQASTRRPRARSPQHIIDAFMGDGSPLTPEDEAELAARLRRNDENMQRRTFRDGIERLMND